MRYPRKSNFRSYRAMCSGQETVCCKSRTRFSAKMLYDRGLMIPMIEMDQQYQRYATLQSNSDY